MKKRTIAMLLALLLVLSLTAACGSSGTDTQPSSPAESEDAAAPEAPAEPEAPEAPAEPAAPEAPPAEPEAPAEPPEGAPEEGPAEESLLPITDELVTLTCWVANPPPMTMQFGPIEEWEGPKYWEERSNIHFEFTEASMATANETFPIMIASQEYPDLISAFGAYYAAGFDNAIEEGIIIDHSALVDEYMPNFKKVLYSHDDWVKNAYTDSGNLGQIPQIFEDRTSPNLGLVIRSDWLADLGLSAPETYTELHDALMQFKTEKDASNALYVPYMGVYTGDTLTAGYGVAGASVGQKYIPFYQEDNVVKYGPMEEGFRDYLTMMNQWYSEGLIYQDFYSWTTANMYPPDEIISDESCGVWTTQLNYITGYYDGWTDDEDFGITALHDPTIEPGTINVIKKVDTAPGPTISFGIAVTTACDEALLPVVGKWLDYWWSEEGQIAREWGVENETYVVKPDGSLSYTDEILADVGNRNVYTMPFTPSGMATYDLLDAEFSFYSDEQLRAVEMWGMMSNQNNLPSSLAMTADESSDYSLAFGDIDSYVATSIVEFIIGTKPLSEFDSYVENIKAMDIDACIASYQAAYDRWLER